jgi:hypothetical protein
MPLGLDRGHGPRVSVGQVIWVQTQAGCAGRKSGELLNYILERKGIDSAVSSYLKAIPGGNRGFEMTKPHHGGTRTCG